MASSGKHFCMAHWSLNDSGDNGAARVSITESATHYLLGQITIDSILHNVKTFHPNLNPMTHDPPEFPFLVVTVLHASDPKMCS